MTMNTRIAPQPFNFTQVHRMGPAALRRLVTVGPGMCGPTKAFASCVGDWTWESVSDACGIDVFNARDDRGRPTYLSFYYYRITSGDSFHLKQLTFGDRLEVQTQVFDAGRRAVLTMHRLRRITGSEDDHVITPFEVSEAYTRHREDCIYVENLNMWVSRGGTHTNVGLVRSPPIGFDNTVLPTLPDEYSPRFLCSQARTQHVFPDPVTDSWSARGSHFVVEYPVNITLDVNGAGLLYFASFFSIAEHAQLEQWRALGRSDQAFLDRVIRDTRICYLGNADIDTTLRLRLHSVYNPQDPAEEKTNIVIDDLSTDRTIAVAASRHRSHEATPTAASPPP
ncbi:biosynthesis cluster domain-containing protein [Streptomyces sp. 110]|uniref:Biosynthesis cluster domain-containing protein n=1 Tax=Streptomyces endocoffeicus TaxID=2898945 RepID=A0ABS1PSC4_9ACTN|nr:LnmK family bifunctional acyltransferase/decarboxylase [Streptomyces endocoffeicus]MBL1115340.1 biosynthesis cluster domain-containing protein [Streptomyces endocoffeicus]